MPALRNRVGLVVGRLTVVGRAENSPHGHTRWTCLCECGTVTIVTAPALKGAKTRSCGCLAREASRRTGFANRRHGNARGVAQSTRTYNSWFHMIQRCTDPRSEHWRYWGARGIAVCERWRTFENFLADMGERPPDRTLDRINNDGNYEPGNVRWATAAEQSRNTRRTRWITINGARRTFTEWCSLAGIYTSTAYVRLGRGWPIERAVSEPSHHAPRRTSLRGLQATSYP